MASLSSRVGAVGAGCGVEGVEDGEEVAYLVEGSGPTQGERVHDREARQVAERGVDRIMCYGSRVAVLISVDVIRRLMGHLKPIQALFVFRVVSTQVINAAA
ncbi:hypothetical protein AB0J85_04115 [Micromonospora echinofusca]|uniref:hypothetical protein n=1 Tax=Micromonospora echinofusca TaxID=47858 RepID=UPI003446C6FC